MHLFQARFAKLILTSRDPDQNLVWKNSDRIEIHRLDLQDVDAACEALIDCEIVVFLPILTLSAPVAEAMRKRGSDARFIMLSSNNVGLDESAQVYQELGKAEERIRALKEPWAILRPTMIYGYAGDGNMGRLMQMARKSPFLPLFGSGDALQQPLHFLDLADLIGHLITELDWRRVEISVGGPDIVSLETIYELAVTHSGGKASVQKIPVGLVRPLIRLMEAIGLKPPIKSAQLDRVEVDKLPTWPECETWLPQISLEDGMAVLGEGFQTPTKPDA